jgi:cell division septation protein DedD
MLSEKRLSRLRKSAVSLCFALSVSLSSPPMLHSAEERSYALTIQKYVNEDKVYLLENIQQNITIPSEKIVVYALLCESGPQAIDLFKKQLRDYPNPLLDQLSTSRIAAYNLALNSTAPLPKLSRPLLPAKPTVTAVEDSTKQKPASTTNLTSALPDRSKQETSIANKGGFTLQFGIFANKENADALVNKISVYEQAKTIQQGVLFKVRLIKAYASKEDAVNLAKELPFKAIIVPDIEAPR